jgi:hypothetical protein
MPRQIDRSAAMKERRSVSRQKSFLQGRIFYNQRRSSVDCLVRDFSDIGAKLKFSESISVPEVMELYIPNRDEFRRARVQWRTAGEMGVTFGEEVDAPSITVAKASTDLPVRMQKLETEIVALKRIVNELRAEIRKAHGEVA